MSRTCDCDEGHLLQYDRKEAAREEFLETQNGRPTARIGAQEVLRYRTGFPDLHCCRWVAGRNALIPQAASWANAAIGHIPRTAVEEREWNLEFLAELARLVRYTGLYAATQDCHCEGCLQRS